MSSRKNPSDNLESAQLALVYADAQLDQIQDFLARAWRGIELARTYIAAQQLNKPHPDEGDRPARPPGTVIPFPI